MARSEGNMSLKNPVTPPGIDPGTVRLVAQRLNHYATPGPLLLLLCTVRYIISALSFIPACCLYYGVSPRYSGFPDIPDHLSPHTVRMNEGLL
jgi:hypothetical protein